MKKTLEPFQEAGAAFLASRYHAAIGDERGLGKTVQAIAAVERLGLDRVLVVCPASVRSNWSEELDLCLGRGGHAQWGVISYEGARKLAGSTMRHQAVIIDESHFCKTLESQRTAAVFGKNGLARRADYKWCLSGTLAPNSRPVELYPMLKTLHPAFKDMSFAAYTQKYCGAFYDGRGMNVKGATRVEELAVLLREFMLRRTKKEVYPDRKAPLISRVPVELSAADLAAVTAAEDEIGGRAARLSSRYEDFSQLGDSSKLLRLLGVAMVPHVIDFVKDLLVSIEKVVVFARHVEVMDALMTYFSKHGCEPALYRGGMSDTQKDANKARFMSDPSCRVFVGQRQAAGTGINGLQRVCSTAVIAEPPWVPGETDQLIGRLDRMGQEDDIVNAYVMYARGTLGAIVVQVHDRKEERGARLMGDI